MSSPREFAWAPTKSSRLSAWAEWARCIALGMFAWDADVAIKILTASFAADAERIGRFEREAQTLALLNHPNMRPSMGLKIQVMRLLW